ncbi:shikimate kinase [Tepidibacillus infernus]|uniref:Shikimate kinase n=1 Tax=Tepidibacillus decaturensis TaxID=1413211 RepID=A0A135L2R0_9BACI|nr:MULTISPECIES: shikimate kinase [Tepidibacillus]KXG43252.1 hypothetical protein U473_03900 [Tepidibacillus decaturensis]GBF10994.1 shikimate kinase [Tepidibacillus sp. HK-1]
MDLLKEHLVLIGFMGVGKTTLGQALANHMGISYIDTDDLIVQKEKSDIPTIFAKKGEHYFRKIESQVFLKTLGQKPFSVISTGGGIVLSEKNRSAMKEQMVIWLQASVDEIYKRISNNGDRPLLKNGTDVKRNILDMMNERHALYEQVANFSIDTDQKSINQMIEEILQMLNLK